MRQTGVTAVAGAREDKDPTVCSPGLASLDIQAANTYSEIPRASHHQYVINNGGGEEEGAGKVRVNSVPSGLWHRLDLRRYDKKGEQGGPGRAGRPRDIPLRSTPEAADTAHHRLQLVCPDPSQNF